MKSSFFMKALESVKNYNRGVPQLYQVGKSHKLAREGQHDWQDESREYKEWKKTNFTLMSISSTDQQVKLYYYYFGEQTNWHRLLKSVDTSASRKSAENLFKL